MRPEVVHSSLRATDIIQQPFIGDRMLLTGAIALIVLWLVVVFVFKITKTLIHLALIIAIVMVALWFFSGARTT
jgi:hypothetical protein